MSGLVRLSRLHVILLLRSFLFVCDSTCNHVKDGVCSRKKEVQAPLTSGCQSTLRKLGQTRKEVQPVGAYALSRGEGK